MWLIAVLGAFIGATTGLVGAGGSFLTVLLLIHAAGFEIGSAVATSLVAVGGMSLVAVIPYAMEGAIEWRAAAAFGLPSTAGACLGGLVSTMIPSKVLLVVFLLTMLAAAGMMLWKRPPWVNRVPASRLPHVIVSSGVLLGGLAGMVGLGGGFAVVPLMTLLAGAPIRSAIGTSLVVVAMTKAAGVVGHLPHHVSIDWRTAMFVGVAEAGGSVVGAFIAKRLSAGVLRLVFSGLMLVVATYLLGSALLRP